MDAALAPVFERVKDTMDEAAFLARVEELDASFGGLLDLEALGLYILDEAGRNEGAVVTLADARGRPEASVDVSVDGVGPVRTFEREKGEGRVVNVDVSDPTGRARLVLWDRDVEKVEEGTIQSGARVRVVNARVKDSRFGLELTVTAWTVLEVEGAPDAAKRKLLTDTLPEGARPDFAATPPVVAADDGAVEPTELAGARDGDFAPVAVADVVKLHATRPFRRSDGSLGFVATLDVRDAAGPATVTLWDEAVRAAQGLTPGDAVRFTDLEAKARRGVVSWHTRRGSVVARHEA